MTSLDEKEKGAAAWTANNYPLAITHFTKAIEIGGEKDFLKVSESMLACSLSKILTIALRLNFKVIYSNRSVANLKLNKFKEAIDDASKCVELDSNWAKGYTRKGDALYSSCKYTDSFNAYNSAKRLSPTDQSLLDKCELAMKAIRIEADKAAGSSNRESSSASAPTIIPGGLMGQIVIKGRYLVIACAILYLLPFGRTFSSTVYK